MAVYFLVFEPSSLKEFYLVYKPSLAKMVSIFSHKMVEIMQIAISV